MASRTAWQRGVARRPDRRQCGIVVVGQVCRMVWFGRNAFAAALYRPAAVRSQLSETCCSVNASRRLAIAVIAAARRDATTPQPHRARANAERSTDEPCQRWYHHHRKLHTSFQVVLYHFSFSKLP
nr:unnamed protein product [Callosobruchus chinensis]